MADNVTANAGSGGATFATDDDGTSHHPYTKIEWGADNTQTKVSTGASALPIQDGGNSITVDGTVTANLSATDNAVLDSINTAVSGTLTVDGSAVTHPVSGTVTANLSATDNAVLDNIDTQTALIDDTIFADDAAFTLASSKVNMAGAIRDDSLTTLTAVEGDAVPLRVSSTGALHVTGGGGGTEYTDDTSTHSTGSSVGGLMMAAATPTDSAVDANDIGAVAMSVDRRLHVDAQLVGQDADITIADGGNVISVDDGAGSLTVDNAALSVTGGGAEATALRVTLANDSTGVLSIDDNGGAITVDGTVTANLSATDNAVLDSIDTNTGYGTVTGGGTETGALRVTIANNSTGVLSVDDNGGALTVDGTVTANLSATDNAVLDNIDTQTSPGTSHYRNIDANAESAIKSSAGTLFWLHVMNLTAAKAYLHLYDATTANVTPGTTTPDYTFPIPTQGDTNGAGFTISLGANGQAFANAITLVCTTTTGGSAGDPGTNGVFVNAGYS